MKKTIILSALLSIITAFSYAGEPSAKNAELSNSVRIIGLDSKVFIKIRTIKDLPANTNVIVTNGAGEVLYSGKLHNHAGNATGFDFSNMEDGDYTLAISTGKQEVTKQIHIYNDSGVKSYIFLQ